MPHHRLNYYYYHNSSPKMGCGCILTLLAAQIVIGGYLFQYCIWTIFGKDLPWYVDAVGGLITAEISVPVAFVCWVMQTFGLMAVPFVG